MCVLVVQTLNTCSGMNVHLYDSLEHFTKLSIEFDARNGYFVLKAEVVLTCIFGVSTFIR